MRNFIKKIIYFLIAGCFSCLLYFHFKVRNEGIAFFSNSFSYNAKARFIMNNYKRFTGSDIILFGSSMTLNNVDGKMIGDSLSKSVFNIGSWGMRINGFKDFPIYDSSKAIIINTQFPDFGNSWIMQKKGYPFKFGHRCEYFNILCDLQTYKYQSEELLLYGSAAGETDYKCLHFDSTGSAVLRKENFNIDKNRWNEKIKLPGPDDLISYVEQLSIFKHNKSVTIFFSPERSVFYDAERIKWVDALGKAIIARYPTYYFFNNYTLKYNDSLFVDVCHFNDVGRSLYTKAMIEELKSINTGRESDKRSQLTP